MAGEATAPAVVLGELAANVEEAIARLRRDNVVERIWNADHTVCSPAARDVRGP